jgi:hypothetical protein
MGAASISVFAAARILRLPDSPIMAAGRAVITGLGVVLWVLATALIPVLVTLTALRWLRPPLRLRYDPQVWTIVFPVGRAGLRAC